ncbi:MAG: hypothetical protein JWM27_166 [Gemmatimonadetes bacterium]|nr:hypothetical protein [Gemmatimonadota bacterium]
MPPTHMALADAFAELLAQPSLSPGIGFRARRVAGMEAHRIGVSPAGSPALLISALAPESQRRPPPMELEHLSIQYHASCRLVGDDGSSSEEPFTVLQLDGVDGALVDHFLRVGATVLTLLGPQPRLSEVEGAIGAFVELFRALGLPPRKSVQGLWAEVFVAANASDPAVLVTAWHATPEDRYDFHAGGQRLEVKSVGGRARRHRFSFEQLQPPPDTSVMIASVFVERTGGGLSLRSLLDRLSTRLAGHPHLQLRAEQVVSSTLGQALPHAVSAAFDAELAAHSLTFYPHHEVPRLLSLPTGVTDVTFTADLSGSTAAEPSALSTGLFAASRPRPTG